MKVSIGISNRHVHLKENDYKILFGEIEFIKKNDLKQPGQFASNSKVTIVGSKGKIDNVRVLGPFRDYTQVEVSKSDTFVLGVNPPVRESGDLKGSEKITLIGPKGTLNLEEGCIIANRHIHINPKQLELYGFKENQIVSLLIPGDKATILNNVCFNVKEDSYFEAHLDTDDANASLISNNDVVEIII